MQSTAVDNVHDDLGASSNSFFQIRVNSYGLARWCGRTPSTSNGPDRNVPVGGEPCTPPPLDLQELSRNLSDSLRYPPAAPRSESHGLEDQQIQRTLRKLDACQRYPFRFYRSILRAFPVEVQG